LPAHMLASSAFLLGFTSPPQGPCDIYAAGGTPCVAAHSTVRALYASFAGPLYQLNRTLDKVTINITTLASGFADAAAQEKFCADPSAGCVIQKIYDQSPRGNHLSIAPPGGCVHHGDNPVDAMKERLLVGGNPVYAAYFDSGMGYRNDNTSGIATGDEPESIYMVTSGTHYNNKCCFDYGNAETDDNDDGAGTMEAVYFGNAKGGLNHGGAGKGPWIMADMENALWGADVVKSDEPLINHTFVTAMIKGDASAPLPGKDYTVGVDYSGHDLSPCGAHGCALPPNGSHVDCEAQCNSTQACVGYVYADESCSSGPALCWLKSAMAGDGTPRACRNSRVLRTYDGHWSIKGGDAQAGSLLVYWDGKRAPNYAPMRKQGAIILGIGGDNSNGAIGTFYEGAMTAGYSSDAVDAAVQASIVAAGYGQ